MTAKRRDASAAALARRATELGVAVPQVMAHRLARIALAGPRPSARDRHEFTRMVVEKQAAFGEAMLAMSLHGAAAGRAIAASMWSASGWTPMAMARAWQTAACGVLGKGVAPLHRKATANARRLKATRLV